MKSEKVKYPISLCERNEIKEFVENNHYSGNINGVISDYCFKMINSDNEIIGAAIFGRMAMANQYKKFSDDPEEVIELRRLCCSEKAVRNSESYLIGFCLRWFKKNVDSLKTIVSYADEEYGHKGIIYRATNFKYDGFRKGSKVIIWKGKKYHDKAIRTKYKGNLKPFAVLLKNALEIGEAFYANTKGKHCYIYTL